MSETVGHVGKLVPMYPSSDAELDTKLRWAAAEVGLEVDEDEDPMEAIVFDTQSRLVVISDEVYRRFDTEFDPGEYVKLTRNVDGSLDYTAIWYNGAGSFEEVIGEALEDTE